MMRVALLGAASHPFAEGMARAGPTHLAFDKVDALDDQRLAAAEALVAIRYDSGAIAMPKLKLIQVPGAGYDGIDLKAVPRGVALCNVFEHEPAVAEYAMLAMLEWCVRLGQADRAVRAGDWSRSSRYGGGADAELYGRTLAVVGLGRIGRAVARRARGFGMRVIAANRTIRDDARDVVSVRGLDMLEAVLAEADYVVLACAVTPETTGLIDARALAAMKPGAVIVNVARGPVIDEAALHAALSQRRIGGAVIDTWWRYPDGARTDPAAAPYRFDLLDNVILSPHIAGWTTGTVERRTLAMARNLDRLARGEPLENRISLGK